jgi:hypothetical protein
MKLWSRGWTCADSFSGTTLHRTNQLFWALAMVEGGRGLERLFEPKSHLFPGVDFYCEPFCESEGSQPGKDRSMRATGCE